jgi:mannose-6-phosphate isomerase
MNRLLRLENPIQEYAWGSFSAIARLLGHAIPSDAPQAELWMGAHPKAPSMVVVDGKRRSLADVIAADPVGVLGEDVACRFDNRLPYLFKVLAAARPLSIQAHPSRAHARQGFARENREQIAVSAPRRNYRDDNHKPECLCALTPFWGLCGFRPISDLYNRMRPLCSKLASELDRLANCPDDAGLEAFFSTLMTLSRPRRLSVIHQAVNGATAFADQDPACRWIGRLFDQYPEDIMVLAPLFLNLVRLDPGQALFLASGRLHAYLDGVGIELMANSDNVLRGGLTGKHIDVPELIRVLSFAPEPIRPLEPVPGNEGEKRYVTPAAEFALAVIRTGRASGRLKMPIRSVSILLCTEGKAVLETAKESMPVAQGQSVLVPAGVSHLFIAGQAMVYKADVPVT